MNFFVIPKTENIHLGITTRKIAKLFLFICHWYPAEDWYAMFGIDIRLIANNTFDYIQ